ncbi:hypothetical protein PAMP_015545 [Pampus punctatissimus]
MRARSPRRSRTEDRQPLNYPLSGCVLVAGPYRFSPDVSYPRGDGRMEGDRPSSAPLKRFEEGRWALRGLDSFLSLGLVLSLSAYFFLSLLLFLTLHFFKLSWL